MIAILQRLHNQRQEQKEALLAVSILYRKGFNSMTDVLWKLLRIICIVLFCLWFVWGIVGFSKGWFQF